MNFNFSFPQLKLPKIPTDGTLELRVGLVDAELTGGVYQVTLLRSRATLTCHNAVGFFAGICGLRTHIGLGQGTKVLVACSPSENFIVSTLPDDLPDLANGLNRTLTGIQDEIGAFGSTPPGEGTHSTPPLDLLSGELDLTLLTGCGLRLLFGLAGLSAGDRAKVECFLVDGLVRIISDDYRHFSAGGEFRVTDDGRPWFEWNGSNYTHELYGRLAKEDEKFDFNQGKPDLKTIDDLTETGRYRLTMLGLWLGDLVHMFISDPAETVGQFGQSAKRSGKLAVWAGSDGSLAVRSVADISFERVVRIPVPVRLRPGSSPDSITGDAYDAASTANAELLRLWKTKEEDAWMSVYQVRDYARWLANLHSVARLHQMSADWHVPSEAETPEPSWNNAEADRETVNQEVMTYRDVYSCIRIFRTGEILLLGGEGVAVTMERKDLTLSAPHSIRLVAGEDITMVAGRSVFVRARKHLEFTADLGGLILKSKAFFRSICEKGSMLFRSGAADPEYDSPMPAAGENEPAYEVASGALVFESGGKTLFTSKRRFQFETTAPPTASLVNPSEDIEKWDTSSGFVVQTRGSVILRAQKNVGIWATGLMTKVTDILFGATGKVIFRNPSLIALGQSVMIRTSTLYAGVVKALWGDFTSNLSGPKKGPTTDPEQLTRGVPAHLNHVNLVPETLAAEVDENKKLTEGEVTFITENFEDPAPDAMPEFAGTRPLYGFLDPDEYEPIGEKKLARPISQAEMVDEPDSGTLYGTWSLQSGMLALQDGVDGARSKPYGGALRHLEFESVTGRLDVPSPLAGSGIPREGETPSGAPITYRFRKT